MTLRLRSGQARAVRLVVLLFVLLIAYPTPVMPQTRAGIFPLREVRAGQIAVAKSVFRGAKIESFHVKIIGVIPKYEGSRSIILGRILDGPVVARKSGVIGGMSGSPVYIKGRLAGAISMTYAFSREPIAGITPIEDMLEAFAEPGARVEEAPAGGRLAAPVQIGGRTIGRVQIAPVPPSEPDPPGVMTLVPLGGLLQASGFGPRAVEQLEQDLAPYGLRVAAAGGGVEEKMRPPMVPGAALGARLVGGDFDLTFLGTVTMVEGNRVLGFGHPLFSRGDVDLPMTGGYVYDILPSIYLSNKIMAPTQVVGRVFRDHQSAAAGTLGGNADMVPVTVEVTDSDLGRSRAFHVEVARVRELTPMLVAATVLAAVDEMRGRISRGTARVRVEIEAEGKTLAREDVDYSPSDAAAVAVPAVLQPLSMLTESQFGEMRVDRVRVKVRTAQARKTAAIERVTISHSRAKAGDEVVLAVTIRPYGEAATDIPVKVRLPADLPKGQVRVVISRGSDADQARTAIGAPAPAPVNAEQLVERYLAQGKGTDLVLQAALPRTGASLSGEELPNLPRTALEALGATRPTDLRPLPSLLKIVVPTDWVLTGRQSLIIPVDSPISAVGGPPRPPREAPPEEGEQPEEESRGISLTPLTLDNGTIELAAGRPAPAARATSDGEEKKEQTALTRAPEMWRQSAPGDYETSKLSNVSLSGDGALALSLSTQLLSPIPADVVWAVAARDGNVYAGTGKDGRIFRLGADGQLSPFAATGEMNVHALAFAPDGSLYAGTSPRGKVFRISSDGKCELAFDSDSTYIWALAVAPDGAVYAGGGSPGRVYALKPDGGATVAAELPVANVLSLAVGQNKDVYAGTSDLGLIFRIAPDSAVTTVGQVPGASADGLALDSTGNLYATCSPGGQLYRIAPGRQPELYLETGQQTAFGLTLLPDGAPAIATGPKGLVVRAADKLKPELLHRPESGIATAIAQGGGALYVATSAPSVLFKLGPDRATSGIVESDVFDAERPATWGLVHLVAETTTGTSVTVETRSGDSPIPGAGWRPWTPTVSNAIASPAARYLQYRLTLSTDKPNISPVVRQVTISRRPQNRPPQVTLRSPEAGQYLSKKQNMKWQAQDPDKDPLAFRVEASPDLGATWSEIAKNLREPKYDWDTTKQKDGQYLLRVTASDALSVPDDPCANDVAKVVWVDNTAPSLMIFKSSIAVDEQRRATVSAMATDKVSPIQSVEYQVDDGEWRSLPIGVVESAIAVVTVVTDPLDAGKRKLTLRAFDAAGNVATESTDVEVPAVPAPSAAEGPVLSGAEGKEAKPPQAATPPPAAQQPAEAEEPTTEQPQPAGEAGAAPPGESAPAAPAP